MRLASLSLCYARENRDFAQLADAIGRRGVVPFLSEQEEDPADPAEPETALTAVVLSDEAVRSGWVERWTRSTLNQNPNLKVIPITFNDPRDLILGQRELKKRWMNAYDEVEVEYIDLSARPAGTDMVTFAADRLARRVYERIGARDAQELGICLDQRGHGGRRSGRPVIPGPIARLDAPVLVFRPDRRQRTPQEVIRADEWDTLAQTVRRSLGEALGPRGGGPTQVHLFGDAQLGWPYLMGRIFDRASGRVLHAHNQVPAVTFRRDWERDDLPQGDPSQARWAGGAPQRASRIALLLGKGKYLDTTQAFLKKKGGRGAPLPLAHLSHELRIEQRAVDQLIADAVAFLEACGKDHGTREAFLFCDLPFAVMPLLSGQLVNVLDGHITYFEYRKDLQDVRPRPGDDAWYEELRMPVSP